MMKGNERRRGWDLGRVLPLQPAMGPIPRGAVRPNMARKSRHRCSSATQVEGKEDPKWAGTEGRRVRLGRKGWTIHYLVVILAAVDMQARRW